MASCWQPAQLMVLKNNRKDEISEFWFLNDNIHKVVWVNMQWWAWTKLVLKHISHPAHLTLLLKWYLTHCLSTYHTLIHIQEKNLVLLKGYLTHYWHKWKIYLVRFMFLKGHRPALNLVKMKKHSQWHTLLVRNCLLQRVKPVMGKIFTFLMQELLNA